MPQSTHSLIRLGEVQRRTGYSKAWIYRLISHGKFPTSVKIGIRAIAFVESEIDEWINQRIAESRKEVA
ncbi:MULTISPECIES: helix-turn-helix transcriptional regulator [Yersinia]|uniref:helix-turn-helix transcriptional regulator n=1 Tax=Yersinia TaxID=629 RepID=UPI0005DBD6B4|nr:MULTISPECIES: AlpA family transcriptional regulator [Yersinia]ARB85971.1 AlpA family transcriptional regulator [Yersinia sp. FDAARGOS_228]AVL35818.1 AlpA family transcriptional regulator [Yersinia intermedia]MDN0103003.1 AlpA family transcriptional regulator [Yersinia bercovieri]CNI88593.1 Regulatory protein [Yersinia bercovieri]